MLMCRKFSAFTLIELLVVISITALLLSILLPVLQSAREQARKITCLSILRNFSMAHKLYMSETGKCLPHTNYNPYTPWYNNDYFRKAVGLSKLTDEQKQRRSTRFHATEIQEWQPNAPRRFICPSASYALKHSENGLYPIDRSYGVNVDGDYYAKKQGLDPSLKEIWIRHPSEKLFMADALDWWVSYFFCHLYPQWGENYVGFETYGMTAYRHRNYVNLIYWDGHCGSLHADEVMSNPFLWDPLK